MADLIKQLPVWALRLIATVLLLIVLYLIYKVSAGAVLITPWGQFGFAEKGYVAATLDWTEVASEAVAKSGFNSKCEYRMRLEGDLVHPPTANSDPNPSYFFETEGVGILATEVVSKKTDFTGMHMYFNVVHPKFLMVTTGRMFVVVRPSNSKSAYINAGGASLTSETLTILLEQRCTVDNAGGG